MANALVVRRGTSLAKRNITLRAAQYVRMSTELQRYSIQNQAAAIAAYAQQNQLTIVRTYVDEGRSGLRIKGRAGLIELIEDVQSRCAEFGHILVYDVSRWGRFQDVDESAYYEFICKQAGVRVAYCAEQFDNDGSLLSSIVKNIKRVMAAEYSRELSVKVHAGQSRIASLGYRVGGPLTFGLRRELVDEQHCSKGRLSKGERKALQTDRVRVRPGSDEEVATVRSIFQQFAIARLSCVKIAQLLNAADTPNQHGRPWTSRMIIAILRNENYVGNVVYNRTCRRLGQKLTKNPKDLWIRGAAAIEPIIDEDLFAKAQKILDHRYVTATEEQMLVSLRMILKRKGHLSTQIIDNTLGASSASSYIKHFGSLRKAYALIGYQVPRDCAWIDSRAYWAEVLTRHVAHSAETLRARRLQIDVEESVPGLAVKGRGQVSFLVARQLARRGTNDMAQWRVHRSRMPPGLLVVLRLGEGNKAIQDYVLLPASKVTGRYLALSETALARRNAFCFNELNGLLTEIEARLGRKSARHQGDFGSKQRRVARKSAK